jgi:hypothetical protein
MRSPVFRLSVLAAFCAALAGAGAAASAATPERLATSGSWTLFRGEFAFVEEDGFAMISPSCFAMTGNDTAAMVFAALPRKVNEQKGELAGVIYLQIGVGSWDFRKHTATVNVGDDSFNLRLEDAFFDDEIIMVNLGGNGATPPAFATAAALWKDKITVSDARDRPLVVFPAGGLSVIYPKLLACAGLD